jgi:hypothetical protein
MELMEVALAGIVFIAGGVLVNALFNELLEWQPRFRIWLLRVAVRRLPESDRARYLEEWAAHLDECPGTFSKLFMVLGFMWAARGIALDLKQGRAVTTKGKTTNVPSPRPSLPASNALEYLSLRVAHVFLLAEFYTKVFYQRKLSRLVTEIIFVVAAILSGVLADKMLGAILLMM